MNTNNYGFYHVLQWMINNISYVFSISAAFLGCRWYYLNRLYYAKKYSYYHKNILISTSHDEHMNPMGYVIGKYFIGFIGDDRKSIHILSWTKINNNRIILHSQESKYDYFDASSPYKNKMSLILKIINDKEYIHDTQNPLDIISDICSYLYKKSDTRYSPQFSLFHAHEMIDHKVSFISSGYHFWLVTRSKIKTDYKREYVRRLCMEYRAGFYKDYFLLFTD